MKESTVTVFGGTGFLGRRVVRRLREYGFSVRIASRHPDRRRVPDIDGPQLESFNADIHDERSVAEAVAGAYVLADRTEKLAKHRFGAAIIILQHYSEMSGPLTLVVGAPFPFTFRSRSPS
jgi:uncharacterized protein YbjT (DUF2867 family)